MAWIFKAGMAGAIAAVIFRKGHHFDVAIPPEAYDDGHGIPDANDEPDQGEDCSGLLLHRIPLSETLPL